jgi:hypothetical protein
MKDDVSEHLLAVAILCFYTFPILIFSGWAQMTTGTGWKILAAGLLLGALGTFAIYRMMTRKHQPEQEEKKDLENQAEEIMTPAIPENHIYQEQIDALQQKVQTAEESYRQLSILYDALREESQHVVKERDTLQHQADLFNQEFQLHKKNVLEQKEYQELLLGEHQHTIAELREALEKKQQHIEQLESKTRDMNYEIKTLLQLAEKPIMTKVEPPVKPVQTLKPPSGMISRWDIEETNVLDFAVRTPEEAHVHLKRLIDLAQRITGTSLFNSSPRFRELPLDNSALDLRSLFDRLKEINASTIIVYSLKEKKLLFVNEPIKDLLGIPPEKFIQSFQENLQSDFQEWHEAIRQLSFKSEAKVSLQLRSRTGQEIPIECLLGMVPTGIFRNYIVGLLYKVSLSKVRD